MHHYAGCNTLKVQYSSMDQLTIRQNNEKSWDFVTPPPALAGGQAGTGGGQQQIGAMGIGSIAPQGGMYMQGAGIDMNLSTLRTWLLTFFFFK